LHIYDQIDILFPAVPLLLRVSIAVGTCLPSHSPATAIYSRSVVLDFSPYITVHNISK
jgi:hypothetical protein